MAGLKELKKRIVSVKNTQQTTRAMKLVSAAKLRRSQDAIFSNRPYAKKVDALIRKVSQIASVSQQETVSSPLVWADQTLQNHEKSILLILVSSDRGLCGGFNANIIKAAQSWIMKNKASFKNVDLAFVGKKAAEVLKIRGYGGVKSWEFGRKAEFGLASDVTHWAIQKFLDGEYQEVKVVYNEFKNAITQTVMTETFLPLHTEESQTLMGEKPEQPSASADLAIVKPSAQEVFDRLLQKHFSTQLFRILLESQASEHGARMSAMDSASRNASEMIKKLTLQYNKQRQAGITKELLEIIAGSESQKN